MYNEWYLEAQDMLGLYKLTYVGNSLILGISFLQKLCPLGYTIPSSIMSALIYSTASCIAYHKTDKLHIIAIYVIASTKKRLLKRHSFKSSVKSCESLCDYEVSRLGFQSFVNKSLHLQILINLKSLVKNEMFY